MEILMYKQYVDDINMVLKNTESESKGLFKYEITPRGGGLKIPLKSVRIGYKKREDGGGSENPPKKCDLIFEQPLNEYIKMK